MIILLGQTGSHDMGMDLGFFPHKRSSRLPGYNMPDYD